MLKMVDVEFIKKKYEVEGWSIRKIARRLEVSRQTVRKVLAGPPAPPHYRQKIPRPKPVMGPYLGIVAYSTQIDQPLRPHADHPFRSCRSASERSDACN